MCATPLHMRLSSQEVGDETKAVQSCLQCLGQDKPHRSLAIPIANTMREKQGGTRL